MNIYAVPKSLARLVEKRKSTWFVGFNEKYFFDAGITLRLAHPLLCHLIVIYLSIFHKEYRIPEKRGAVATVIAYEKGIRYVDKKLWIVD